MTRYGLLIDYEFCTGCHTCELACKQEHQFGTGKTGIKVNEVGPFEIETDKWSLDYIPVPTDLCDLCSNRVSKGKKPSCVAHCQAGVMKFAPIKELAAFMELKAKTVLFAPR
jgi:Fe-S-cluster-containing dehydrogenase component